MRRSSRITIGAAALTLLGASLAMAQTPSFSFDSTAEGWTNQSTEPFLVTFTPGQGFPGGALAISATVPRDSYQIVHGEDQDWPAVPFFFQRISFDVRLEPGVEINPLATGLQIRNGFGHESNVYQATSFSNVGGGWTRVVLDPTNLFDLPHSHDDVGINLHVGTTSVSSSSLVMVIDNIAAVESGGPFPETIDVKPGSILNPINPRSRGKIPVAILTTGSFDATTVDETTVLFGPTGTEAAPIQSALEDIDGDGDVDLILHFNTQATGIQCGDTSASLTGWTLSGQEILGADRVSTPACR